jgi:hypothetical protein
MHVCLAVGGKSYEDKRSSNRATFQLIPNVIPQRLAGERTLRSYESIRRRMLLGFQKEEGRGGRQKAVGRKHKAESRKQQTRQECLPTAVCLLPSAVCLLLSAFC